MKLYQILERLFIVLVLIFCALVGGYAWGIRQSPATHAVTDARMAGVRIGYEAGRTAQQALDERLVIEYQCHVRRQMTPDLVVRSRLYAEHLGRFEGAGAVLAALKAQKPTTTIASVECGALPAMKSPP